MALSCLAVVRFAICSVHIIVVWLAVLPGDMHTARAAPTSSICLTTLQKWARRSTLLM